MAEKQVVVLPYDEQWKQDSDVKFKQAGK